MKYVLCCGNVKDLPKILRQEEQMKKAHQFAADKLLKRNVH